IMNVFYNPRFNYNEKISAIDIDDKRTDVHFHFEIKNIDSEFVDKYLSRADLTSDELKELKFLVTRILNSDKNNKMMSLFHKVKDSKKESILQSIERKIQEREQVERRPKEISQPPPKAELPKPTSPPPAPPKKRRLENAEVSFDPAVTEASGAHIKQNLQQQELNRWLKQFDQILFEKLESITKDDDAEGLDFVYEDYTGAENFLYSEIRSQLDLTLRELLKTFNRSDLPNLILKLGRAKQGSPQFNKLIEEINKYVQVFRENLGSMMMAQTDTIRANVLKTIDNTTAPGSVDRDFVTSNEWEKLVQAIIKRSNYEFLYYLDRYVDSK
ncbi:MAG: hypothetical protein KDK65_07665, partial [Chlamydiia bacterium]|nr:hypothetical protein [Chlamydiia bacterium]